MSELMKSGFNNSDWLESDCNNLDCPSCYMLLEALKIAVRALEVYRDGSTYGVAYSALIKIRKLRGIE